MEINNENNHNAGRNNDSKKTTFNLLHEFSLLSIVALFIRRSMSFNYGTQLVPSLLGKCAPADTESPEE
jgi:hypothetical protein